MTHEYKDGKIVVYGKYHERVPYDMSNEYISVTADGVGGLSSYRIANREGDCIHTFLGLSRAVNGTPVDVYAEKRVEMIGRTQTLFFPCGETNVSIKLFLSREVNGIFCEVAAAPQDGISLTFNCRDAKKERDVLGVKCVEEPHFILSSDKAGDWHVANDAFYTEGQGSIRLLFSFDADIDGHKEAFLRFDEYKASSEREIEEIKLPAFAKTEEEKALFYSAYFTALENHKSIGSFRAFAAGCAYLYPLRTYFRDGYFTLLPFFESHPEYVRDDLLTLARGIAPDGTCPSAVKCDYTAFWGDHYDSPSFFVMALYDLVSHTKDESILSERIGEKTMLDIADAVLSKLSEHADESGLLYKEGAYNKRDWADEVNRNGYVTYVEALYARALRCASKLFRHRDDEKADAYHAAYERVKDAINTLLFDEERGYYVNYKSADYTEKNLSIDTVFTVLFGIADDWRARSVLHAMESLLETRHNKEQKGGDFGVMCVYPPYGKLTATAHKSMRPYDYHNGANWCYLTAMYAYAQYLYGGDYRYPLLSCFDYNVSRGHYTLVEYFSPACPTGGALQAWSGDIAFVCEQIGRPPFFD